MLSSGENLRIYPVYYVPSLTYKLLSLGTFLQKGLLCTGTSREIQVIKDSYPFLSFRPRTPTDSIYVIRSLAAKTAEKYSTINTIYKVDYEIIH